MNRIWLVEERYRRRRRYSQNKSQVTFNICICSCLFRHKRHHSRYHRNRTTTTSEGGRQIERNVSNCSNDATLSSLNDNPFFKTSRGNTTSGRRPGHVMSVGGDSSALSWKQDADNMADFRSITDTHGEGSMRMRTGRVGSRLSHHHQPRLPVDMRSLEDGELTLVHQPSSLLTVDRS